MTPEERAEVIAWIQSEHAQRRALNIHAVKRRRPDLLAKVYEVRPYWGWRQALEDAGVPYSEIKVELLKKVRCAICGFEGAELASHLNSRHGLTGAQYHEQYPGAEVSAERQRAKRRRKGRLSLSHWEPLYSDEYIMDRVWQHHLRGHPLNTTWVYRNDLNLWQHIHRQGRNWEAFVTDLGIPYPKACAVAVHAPEPDETLARLRSLSAELGQAPTYAWLEKNEPNLAYAVRKHFGRIRAALQQAGLVAPKRKKAPRRAMGEDEALERIRVLMQEGVVITPEVIRVRESRLHGAISRLLGGYPAVRRRVGAHDPARPQLPRLSPEEVKTRIRERAAAGLGLRHQDIRKGPHRDTGLIESIITHYGTLAKAVTAAGLPVEKSSQRRKRERREWVIETIRRRHSEKLPLHHQTLATEEGGPELMKQGHIAFNSWRKALAAAGVEAESPTAEKDRAREEEKIRRAAERKRAAAAREQAKARKKAALAKKRAAQALKRAQAKEQAAKARAEAKEQAAKARAEAKEQAAKARAEAKEQAAKARAEAREQAAKAKAEAKALTKKSAAPKARRSSEKKTPQQRPPAAPKVSAPKPPEIIHPPETVLAWLKKRRSQGQPLIRKALWAGSAADRDWVRAAERAFGSWRLALRAAGIDGQGVLPSREKIIAEMRRLAKIDSELLSVSGLLSGDLNRRRLHRAIMKEFGSLQTAWVEAGLVSESPLPSIIRGRGRPPGSKNKPKSRSRDDEPDFDDAHLDVIARIRARAASGAPMRYQAMVSGPIARRDPDLYRAATRLFGGWKQALRAAGVPVR
ncbi:MAG: hypothetical protein JNK37_08800 [Verrucomicrobiales bacterium]|nr:hypothetical protein [Verrucomicrobiales bacterium]